MRRGLPWLALGVAGAFLLAALAAAVLGATAWPFVLVSAAAFLVAVVAAFLQPRETSETERSGEPAEAGTGLSEEPDDGR